MRILAFTLVLVFAATAAAQTQNASPAKSAASAPENYVGFDSNEYPGDDLLPALRKQFAFAGYWLTNPPLTNSNPWVGKREILLRNGFGFLVVANGRWDKEILRAQKAGKSPAAFARQDAAVVVAAARREGFPPHTILFLDQEEGGRMLPEQAAYLLAWTEAVATSGFRPGVYASGQPVNDGKGPNGKPVTITSIQDIRQQVAAQHLHPIAFWDFQGACPPAPGCVVHADHPPSPDRSGTLDLAAWQYALSPRDKSITQVCSATYNDRNCYVPGLAPALDRFPLDLSVSTSPDPSHGR